MLVVSWHPAARRLRAGRRYAQARTGHSRGHHRRDRSGIESGHAGAFHHQLITDNRCVYDIQSYEGDSIMMNQSARYFIPDPSRWPIFGSLALLCMAFGAALWINEATWGKFLLLFGVCTLFYMMFGWFGAVAHESEGGSYNKQVDTSFRWGMSWFIFSEVMFFAAFFGALFYMRVLSVPWLGDLDHKLIWPDFVAQWPTGGPGFAEKFTPMAAWGVPAINTLILLSSGVTVTWAHWGFLKNNRSQLIIGFVITIPPGFTFLYLQTTEYHEAYPQRN